MGRVITELVVKNRIDEAKAEDGLIPADGVRSLALNNVLVDTGATTLCLPKDIIAQLGLKLQEEVPVETATGISTARVFRDVSISLLGREGTFDCLEVPKGNNPLLGVIPMERLGIEVDLQNQKLTVLPKSATKTYLTIL